MRRVVVTGMGIACPLGLGVENVWRRLLAGESGIGLISSFDTTDLPAKIAGTIPAGAKADGKLEKGMKWPKFWSACNKRLKGAG